MPKLPMAKLNMGVFQGLVSAPPAGGYADGKLPQTEIV